MRRLNPCKFAICFAVAVSIAQTPRTSAAQDMTPEQALRAAQQAAQQAQQDELDQRGGGGRARSGRGGGFGGASRGGRGGAFGGADAAFPDAAAQFGAARTQQGFESGVAQSNEPKELITLSLWVLAIDLPRAKAADDLTASLAARANSLPNVIGSPDDVKVLIGKLTVAGLLRYSREYRLTATNGQMASTQMGASQPQVTGTSIGGRGARTSSISYQSVGTIVQMMPRIDANGHLQVSVDYSASGLEKTNPPLVISDPGDGSEPVTAEQIFQQHVVSTVQLKKGTAVLVQSDVKAEPMNETASVRTQLIILSGSILPPLD